MSAQARYTPSPATGAASDEAAQSADIRHFAVRLGIGFDGRYYRYREYRYEHLTDALNYAKLERSRPGWQPADTPPQWLDPRQPTEAERRLMAEFGIAFDGRCFAYDGYRYEHCQDAASYARLKKPDGGVEKGSA